jgi:hypothetical protein
MTNAVLAAFAALGLSLALGVNPFVASASAAVVGLTWAWIRATPKDTDL